MKILPLTDYLTRKSSSSGKLTATILSAYDLPPYSSSDDDGDSNVGEPSHVSMAILGTEMRTGPPSARHKERNSFKFVEHGDGCTGTGE